MRQQKRERPDWTRAGARKEQTRGGGLQGHYTTPALHNASARALERELSIVLMAAHRMAGGYGLVWSDHDRLHEAHTHIVRVLAALKGREVLHDA